MFKLEKKEMLIAYIASEEAIKLILEVTESIASVDLP